MLRSEPPFKPDVLGDMLQNNAPDTTMSLLLWNSATRRAFSVWKHDGVIGSSNSIYWLTGAQNAALPMYWSEQTMQQSADGTQKPVVTEHQTLLFVDTARAVAHESVLPKNAVLYISPVRAQALL